MKIIEVTLENIKSYADRTTIQLQGGVTAILGENGSGKSTIQEAVGFALFDSLPFTISEFVREGASSGTVEVTIEVDERDGKQKYRVTRSAGYSKYGVARYDTKGEEWVDQDIASKDDLVEWLCTRFDLEDGDELQSLWESCIGVPQTRFLSDFAQTPKARTSTFDELLNIDAYEDSWNRLKDTPDHIKAERRGVREEILKLGATVQSLPKEREEKQNLEEKIAELTTEISTAESELAEATKRHDELDDIRERISDLEQEIKQQKQAIDAKESSLQTAQKELETTREAADKCESARDGHEQYLEAEARQEELEEELEKLKTLRKERQTKDAKLGQLQIRRETLQKQVKKHETATENLDEHTEQKQRYEELETRISELEAEQKTVERLREQIISVDNEAREDLADLRKTLATIHEIEAEAAEVADAADLRSQIGDTKAKIKALASEQKDLQEKIDRLRDADADAPCPTCGKSMDAAHRSETIETRETRLEEAQTERKTHREDLSTLEERLVEAEEVEQRVTKLEMYQSRVSDLRAELQDHSDKRTETREEISSRTQDIDDLPNHKTERESLEDAKEAFYTAKTQVKEYEDAPEDLAEVKESIESIEATITDLEDQIEAFDNIEADLETLEETLDTNEEDYKQFERNEQAANKLESRKEAIEEIDGEIEELRAKHGELTNDLESESEAFNQEEFDKLSNEIEDLNGRVHTLTAQKSEKEKTLDKVVDTVDTLEDKLEQRESKIETLRELAADQQFATWVRDNVREAGPKMRDVITDRIGRRADTIFRSIRGQKAEQLEWTSDYDIVVVDADVRKSFSTLSGGEKMAAALAVRLAILEQISGLGIAFLDEPTANLDQDKKANLVSQLTNLDTFEQLTVISHDATFDSMTDYSITIEKPDQTSAVMSD
jgi:exonuclease SbcC